MGDTSINDTLSKIQHRILDLQQDVLKVRHASYNWSLPHGFYDGVYSRVAPNWRRFGTRWDSPEIF